MSQLDNTLKRESFEAEINLHDQIMEKDLKTSHSEVTRYWLPESFEWFKDTRPLVYLSKTSIRLTEAAVELARFTPGCIINIGINKAFIAFKKDVRGLTAKPCKNIKSVTTDNGLYFTGCKITSLLDKNGYNLPCQMVCFWDEKNNMLVAEKPSTKELLSDIQDGF